MRTYMGMAQSMGVGHGKDMRQGMGMSPLDWATHGYGTGHECGHAMDMGTGMGEGMGMRMGTGQGIGMNQNRSLWSIIHWPHRG